jgi:hypothetical protein
MEFVYCVISVMASPLNTGIGLGDCDDGMVGEKVLNFDVADIVFEKRTRISGIGKDAG